MDITTFNRAKQAYNAKSWDTAVILFSQCGTGPGTGEACHLCGNALMRLGRVQEAVQAYRAAAADTEYRNQGAVYTNLGKAQISLGDLRGAVDSLQHALEDSGYPGAYKALIALGDAYSKLGDPRSAGIAYRKAALEDNNPDPAKSLINLGVCFMQLKRPADAAEAYRTALDFSRDAQERNVLNANLGQAYVASNRMIEAVQAFEAALSGGYRLSSAAAADYDRACRASNALAQHVGQTGSGSTEDFLSGYSTGGTSHLDPLDPLGQSGEVLPSPDQSGFFKIDESDIEAASRAARKEQRASSHTGLKILIVVLAAVVVIVGGCILAYVRGFGIPSQASTVNQLFEAVAAGEDASALWSPDVSASARAQSMNEIQPAEEYEIVGMDVSTAESVALVEERLPEGAVLTYKVSLKRELIGWKVSNVERVIASVGEDTYTNATAEPVGMATQPVDAAATDLATTDQAVDAGAADQAAVDQGTEAPVA